MTDSADNADTEINGCNVSACALFTQDKLTINGSGSLTVTGSSVDGIVCKDDLKLVNGTITVEAAQDGVKGKDCVAMFGADLRAVQQCRLAATVCRRKRWCGSQTVRII